MGSATFAFLAAGTFKTEEEAQQKICPQHKMYEPDKNEQKVYDELHTVYSKLYFAFGEPQDLMGNVLPKLIHLAEAVNQGQVAKAS